MCYFLHCSSESVQVQFPHQWKMGCEAVRNDFFCFKVTKVPTLLWLQLELLWKGGGSLPVCFEIGEELSSAPAARVRTVRTQQQATCFHEKVTGLAKCEINTTIWTFRFGSDITASVMIAGRQNGRKEVNAVLELSSNFNGKVASKTCFTKIAKATDTTHSFSWHRKYLQPLEFFTIFMVNLHVRIKKIIILEDSFDCQTHKSRTGFWVTICSLFVYLPIRGIFHLVPSSREPAAVVVSLKPSPSSCSLGSYVSHQRF